LGSFFHKVSFIINALFPPLRDILYSGCIKLFAEASELFAHVVFQLVVIHKMASSQYMPQGLKRWKLEGAKLGLRKDEGEQSTSL